MAPADQRRATFTRDDPHRSLRHRRIGAYGRACDLILVADGDCPRRGRGGLYRGMPALALVMLREQLPRHGLLLGGVFVAVWAADTGALVVGRLFGGPKLAPKLSPNKTWAGLIGGILAAGATEGVYAYAVSGFVLSAVLFGFFLALVGHCGDLFESWVKRRFQAKVTGSLIPGHGGMLDRIDSLLCAAPAAALLILAGGIDPIFGVAP